MCTLFSLVAASTHTHTKPMFSGETQTEIKQRQQHFKQNIHSGLRRRSDRSLYFWCDLLWVKSPILALYSLIVLMCRYWPVKKLLTHSPPILDWQERPQTSHGQTLWFDDVSALRLVCFKRSESMCLSSKSMTASRHRERQADLLHGAWLSSVDQYRRLSDLSLNCLYTSWPGPPGRRRLTISCP